MATAAHWISRWDAQQERYVSDREERFAVIGAVVEHVTAGLGRPPVILDLCCGPGSLSTRLTRLLPGARVIGVDRDPLLVELARRTAEVEVHEVDLTRPGWADSLGVGQVDAAVSTTALHWFSEDGLAALYRELGALVSPGGVFVNGDDIFDDRPAVAALQAAVRTRRAHPTGGEDWAGWWRAIEADPDFADAVAARRACRFPDSHENRVGLSRQGEMLRDAGFAEVTTVWRSGDDVVLVALR